MDEPGTGANDRLDSWKKIASYLKRDVSTVQRWERREAMPVHRHQHDKLGSVFAYRSELDHWWESRRSRLSPEAPAVAPKPRRRLLQWTAGIAIASLVLALAWMALRHAPVDSDPLAHSRFVPLLDFPGTTGESALSRDGKSVAFLASQNGRADVWFSAVGSGTYRSLTRGELPEMVNPALRTLGFSPDGSFVVLWTRHSDGTQPGDVNIMSVPVAGGAPQPFLPGAAELDWSHDGKRLVYHTTAPGDPMFLRESDASGRTVDRRIYAAANGVHCHFPVWSADDGHIYFIRGLPPDQWDLWRIQPSGAGLERMTTHNSRVSFPVVVDARTLLYLATDADGAGPWMYAVDVAKRASRRISAGLESYASLAASADGAKFVATIAQRRTSLWRVAIGGTPSIVLAKGSAPRLGAQSLLYVSSRGDRQGIWSLAGQQEIEIWGSTQQKITGGPSIAADRQHVAFTTEGAGKTYLYVMETDGSHARVVADSLLLRGNPAWSPDGQSILSAVVREGEPRVTRIFLNGEPPLPLLSEYSTDPVWSPDGRFFVYSGADVGTTFPLRAAAADGRPHALPAVMLTRGARRVAFLPDAPGLVILSGDIRHKDFSLLDLETGNQRLLAQLPSDFEIGDFDIADSQIVFDRAEISSDLAFIDRSR